MTVCVVNQEGLPDLLTAQRGVWLPVEIKARGERLTPLQQALYLAAPFPIVHDVAEAVALYGIHL